MLGPCFDAALEMKQLCRRMSVVSYQSHGLSHDIKYAAAVQTVEESEIELPGK